ncbi:MAG: bi-domain-containing oxidoreductase [Kiritimatiellia bacterium]
MRAHPDRVRQVIDMAHRDGVLKTYRRVSDVLARWNATGYSSAGIVAALGADVPELQVGDRVACGGGGYASHAEFVVIPRRLLVRMPAAVGMDEAAFATIGAIAMQGVRQAAPEPCSSVAVIGLGIVGQLVSQIASASGAMVTGIDLVPGRVELAKSLGASATILAGQGGEIEKALSITSGRGYDAVILAASAASSDPARMAAAMARDRGRLVVVGDVGLNLDRQVMYEKELELRLSRSYGPGRYDESYEEEGRDYPYAYVRWTEQRNMESFLALIASRRIQIKPLITHRFTIDEAEKAYEVIVKPQDEPPIGILLEYPQSAEVSVPSQRMPLAVAYSRQSAAVSRPGIGFVGAGSYARSILLPALRGLPAIPIGIVATDGIATTQLGQKFGFEFAGTDVTQLLSDKRVAAIFVATRHSSHAALVTKALEAGKAIFVEKPLAITVESLAELCAVQRRTKGAVMVGFNRRFAPLTDRIKAFFGAGHGPLVLSMRVNAGAMHKHWSQSVSEGGRIIGEVCHFVDFLSFLAEAPLKSVYASSVPVQGENLEENICATLAFSDGSIATLNYNAVGDDRVSKEYLEVFGDGKVAILDDFCSLRLADHGKVENMRGRQDKGHTEEVRRFIRSICDGRPLPIPFAEAVTATLATFALLESCRSREPVAIVPAGVDE